MSRLKWEYPKGARRVPEMNRWARRQSKGAPSQSSIVSGEGHMSVCKGHVPLDQA